MHDGGGGVAQQEVRELRDKEHLAGALSVCQSLWSYACRVVRCYGAGSIDPFTGCSFQTEELIKHHTYPTTHTKLGPCCLR